MSPLLFSIDIQAPIQSVYTAMLGLDDPSTYEYWTAAFNPTSSFEGTWESGSKIYFVGLNEEGKKSGMISRVEEHLPAEKVVIRHYGFWEDGKEVTSGETVESWAGSYEIYTFKSTSAGTTVSVHLDAVEAYQDYFNETYPKDLERLKSLLEK